MRASRQHLAALIALCASSACAVGPHAERLADDAARERDEVRDHPALVDTSAPTTSSAPEPPASTMAASVERDAAAHEAPIDAVAASEEAAIDPRAADATAPTVVLPQPIRPPEDEDAPEPQIDVGMIEIPAIGLHDTMREGIRLMTIDRGPAHWPGSAMPGELGNVVVAGHRASHSQPFRRLHQLVVGDAVIFTTAAGRFTYRVDSVQIVEPDAMWIVDQSAAHTATLFACHPIGSTQQRIVVRLTLDSG